MNSKREMVIIDDKIVTENIAYCNFDVDKNVFNVKYKNNSKIYSFSKNRVKYITNSKLIELKDYNFFVNNKLLENIKEIYEFEYNNNFYYYVIFNNHNYKSYKYDEIKKINKDSYNVIKYLKKVSKITSLDTEDGKKLLCEQMEKVEVSDLDTALANYLKLSTDLLKQNSVETLIFPF